MSRIVKIEIEDGGRYGAYESLVHTVTTLETSILFTITFLGSEIKKRIPAKNGVCSLLLTSVMDNIKKTEYSFRPFSQYGTGAFETLIIDYENAGTQQITINVTDSLTSPANFAISKDFLSRNRCIYYDDRFELGLYFSDEVKLKFETSEGDIEQTVGVQGDLSFQSLRGLGVALANEAEKVDGKGIGFDSNTKIYGFKNGTLGANGAFPTGAILFGDAISWTPNTQENIVNFAGSGVLTSIITNEGERITFEGSTENNPFGTSELKNIFLIENATGYGLTSDNSLFLGHFNGGVKFDTGEFIVNDQAKISQVEV